MSRNETKRNERIDATPILRDLCDEAIHSDDAPEFGSVPPGDFAPWGSDDCSLVVRLLVANHAQTGPGGVLNRFNGFVV